MTPKILIFSIAMGTDYSFYVKTIETLARAFLTLYILAIGRVLCINFSNQQNENDNGILLEFLKNSYFKSVGKAADFAF